jgi:prepilin-type N-terminal cleavage/methylation domain-containing protein
MTGRPSGGLGVCVTSQRGVTLLELMFGVALSGVVMMILMQVVANQTRASLRQMGYAEAQQSARHALAFIESIVEKAGWGMVPNLALTGVVPVGRCRPESGPEDPWAFGCNNRIDDNGSDRLGVVFMDGTSGGPADWFISQPAGAATPDVTKLIGTCEDSDRILVSGTCVSPAVAFLSGFTSVANNGDPCGYVDNVTVCTQYTPPYSAGRAVEVEFFVEDDADDIPHLFMFYRNNNAAIDEAAGNIIDVASNIDDLQIRYLVDTQDAAANPALADGAWDVAIDDISTAANTDCGVHANAACAVRVVGVQVAVVVRSALGEPGRNDAPPEVFDHNPGPADNVRRWVYRSTIALRNFDL